MPAVGCSSAITARASVDLPDPDSPTTPNERPGWIVRLTPSTARRVACGANQLGRARR